MGLRRGAAGPAKRMGTSLHTSGVLSSHVRWTLSEYPYIGGAPTVQADEQSPDQSHHVCLLCAVQVHILADATAVHITQNSVSPIVPAGAITPQKLAGLAWSRAQTCVPC